MTAPILSPLPTAPDVGGRWFDRGTSGVSLVVLQAATLPANAEWYISAAESSAVPNTGEGLNPTDWTGPVNMAGTNGPVLVFTVKSLAGTPINRYHQYYYRVGQRDPGNHLTFVQTPVSAGVYPTDGWNNGTAIRPTISATPNSGQQYTLSWNATSGPDFSKNYVVQRARGTRAPSTPTMPGNTGQGAVYAQGTSEDNALSSNGIEGFYEYQTTADTSVPLSIINSNKAEWTWFRVLAYSKLWGYTGAFLHGAASAPWIGVPNDPAIYQVTETPTGSQIVVGEPTDPDPVGAAGVSDPVNARDLPVETNLPMLKTGIGGVSHMYSRDGDAAHRSVRWREGMLVLNADQTVSKAQTSRRWGFRFHYNPSTWSQSSAIAQGIDLTTYSQTGGNLVLPSTFSSVDLTVYLNRIVELSLDVPPDDPEGTSRRIKQLSSEDFFMGTGDGAPTASPGAVSLSVPYFDSANLGAVVPTYDAAVESIPDKVTQILQKGTLADIEYLYRACNGDPVPVTHTDGETADIGMLAMTVLDLYLGPKIKYTVRVNSANIQHMMFNNRMIPIFSQVQLSLVRGITMKDKGSVSTTDYGLKMTAYINDKTSTTGSKP